MGMRIKGTQRILRYAMGMEGKFVGSRGDENRCCGFLVGIS